MKKRIEITDLCLACGEHILLEHADLTLYAGETVAICGISGSGKTTLLSAAAGILSPKHGKVKRRGKVGFVPQSAALLEDMTFAENLRCFAAIARVRIPKALPLAADDLLSVRVRDMSGGMKQLCSLVCTLITAPEILFLDEPYVSLDEAHAAMLTAYLADYVKGGGCLVIVAHRPDEYPPFTDRRICLDGSGGMQIEVIRPSSPQK